MGRPSKHMSKPTFVGLAATVADIVNSFHGIDGVNCVSVRSAQGQPKVKIPARWPTPRELPIVVSDRDYGEREIVVRAVKAGAIARILRKHLLAEGIHVTR